MAARLRKAPRKALIVIAVIIAAALLIALGAPLLIDLPAVQAQLHRKLSHAVNGQVAWDSLHVQLLPSPRGVLHGVRVEIPGRVTAAVEQAEVNLRLPPLLHGRADISSIGITRPAIEIDIAASAQREPTAQGGFFAAYRDALNAIVRSIRNVAPSSVVAIEGAKVVVRAADVTPIELDDLSLHVQTGDRGIDLEVTAAGNLARKLHIAGHVEPADLSSSANLEALELSPQPWLARLVSPPVLGVEVPAADLRAQARTDGKTSLQADIELASPKVRVTRNQRALDVAPLKAKASVVARADNVQVDVTDFQGGKLVPAATATLRVAGDAQHPEISIDAPRLDLAAVRDAVLALAGDVGAVAEYATRIHAGAATRVHFSAAATTWSEILQSQNVAANLSIERGVALVPAIEREATDVSARAALANGTISVDALDARVGDSRLTAGNASYALQDGSMRAESAFDIGLAQGLDVARKMMKHELDAIESASGRLPGRAQVVKTPHTDWKATVQVAKANATVRLKHLPWPAVVHSGHFTASSRQVAVSGLHASLGQSTLESAAVQIAPGSTPRLTGATAQATLALGELYPFLRSQPTLAEALYDTSSVTGTAHVKVTRVVGPLSRPSELQYELSMQPEHVSVVNAQLPDRVSITGGSIAMDPTTLRLDGVVAELLDARATVSGNVANYRDARLQVDARVADGAAGPRMLQWAWERAEIPHQLLPKTPLRFTAARARWGPDRNLDVQGAVQLIGGQDVTADFAWNPRALEVRRIALKDAFSNATASVTSSNRLLKARFSGNIDSRTVAAMFVENAERFGRLEGDLQVALDIDAPKRSTAQGHLTGTSIDLSWVLGQPVHIDQMDVDADGATLRIREAAVRWAKLSAKIAGAVTRGERGAIVDGQLESPGIVLDELLPEKPADSQSSAKPDAEKDDGILPRLWKLPVTGQVTLRAPFVQYREYRVAPVAATVALEQDRARLDVHEAQVCGVDFPLTATATPQALDVAVHLSAQQQPLGNVVRCLTSQEVQMTGRFDLRADLHTHGEPGELARNLTGTVDAQAHDGKTYKFKLIGNILSLKTVTDLLDIGKPQMEKDGLPYRRLDVNGRFDSGKFVIDEGAFDSDAVGLAATGTIDLLAHDSALTVLVAPFNKLNRLVRNVPVAGYVLGGELLSVPVGVRGDIRDPVVTPLGPQAVTHQLTGILERTLQVPARLLAPLDTTKRENLPAAQP